MSGVQGSFQVRVRGNINGAPSGEDFLATVAALQAAQGSSLSPASLDGILFADQFATGSTITDAAITAAIAALPATGGMVVLPPNTTISITARVNITKPNVRLWGPSWNSVVQRAASYTSAELIRFTSTATGGVLDGFTIDGALVATSTGDVALEGVSCQIRNCQHINGASSISIALKADDTAAINNTVTGPSTSGVGGYGIWAITNHRILISGNTVTGTSIDGIGFDGKGSKVIGNTVYGCHCQTPGGGGQIVAYPTVSNGLIANNYVGRGGTGGAANGIEVNGGDVTLDGNIVEDQILTAINVNAGGTVQGVLLTGNTIRNSGSSSPWNGIAIGANAGKVTITGNRIIDTRGTAVSEQHAVFIDTGTGDNFVITGNDFTGSVLAPILDNSTGLNKTYENNLGIDNVLGTIASGATLTLPLNPVISLTGSATATVIAASGCWTGRQGTFIPTGASVFTAGATIGNTLTCVPNVLVEFTFDGTKLYLK